MNEEGAEQQPSPMEGTGEQRTLASIMFTDVVGFSKLASIDEEKTFRALKRDFDLLYREVAAHGGQVLNTMGDGMMVVFLSAVECMKCALSIQKALYNLSLSKPVDGALQHRIGLHIGDIFINGKNTMGDGVNQAARIQSLARPESIAMSAEFHTVVEGKVPFEARNLGGLRAKNIPQNIKIWEVAPIEDEIRQKAAEALFTPPPSANIDGATGRRGVLMILMSMIVIFGGLGIVYMLGATKQTMNKPREKGSVLDTEAGRDKLKERLNIGKQNDPVEVTNSANQPTDVNAIKDAAFALSVAELENVDRMIALHDYEGIVSLGKAHAGAETEDGKSFIAKY
ncbi:MAG TPA: adenylate/guanylate cyclase domain-containing protein, partial [Fimbriimonas sp.]|nr:adenylate/guanylate cyclase domain-containing protein [Fimbriimonas sp.]